MLTNKRDQGLADNAFITKTISGNPEQEGEMIVRTNHPIRFSDSLRKFEMQPVYTAPLFFGAGAALVLTFFGDTVSHKAIALGVFAVLMVLGILAEMRLRHSYETRFIGQGTDGFSSLMKNTPYETLARGVVEGHNWKFAIVSPHPRKKELARFVITGEQLPDHFIKVGHEILPLKDRKPGEKSKPAAGVVHRLDPSAIAATKPAEKHKRRASK